MSKAQDEASHLKSLICDLDERIAGLKQFDPVSEVNFHCDDLIGQVTLTIESAMDHLAKVQTRMVNEINKYRKDRLDSADSSDLTERQEELGKLSKEAESFKANASAYLALDLAAETFQKANELKDRASDLRKQMRAKAFDGRFIRFVETDFLEGDIIGGLQENNRDVQDDFVIKHTVLDDVPKPLLEVEPFTGTEPASYYEKEVTAILFLRDGAKLAIGLRTGLIVIWDLVANKEHDQFKLAETYEGVYATAFAQLPNGHLVSGNNDGNIDIWDLESKKRRLQTIPCTAEKVLWLKVLPNGRLAACCAWIHILELVKRKDQTQTWRVNNGDQLGPDFIELYRESSWGDKFPTESYLSKSCLFRITEYGPDAEDCYGEPSKTFQINFELLNDGHLAYSYLEPDGVRISIWSQESDESVKEIKLVGVDIESCTLLPTGEAVLCRKNSQVEFYSLQDEKMFHSFRNTKGPILAIRQHSRTSLQFVHLKDLQLPVLSKYPLGNIYDPLVSSTCFSSDGKYLAVGSVREKLTIWPTQS